MSRHRSGTKKAPPEIGLHMECTEEDLEPCQIVHYNKAETEYNEIQNKLDNYLNKMKAEVIEKGENCVVLQLNVSTSNTLGTSTQVPPVTSTGKVTRHSAQNFQQVVGQGILTRSSSNATGNTYLVMDPRLGLVVGQVPTTTGSAETAATTPTKTASGTRARPTSGAVMVTTRARSGVKKPVAGATETEILTTNRTRDKVKSQTLVQQPASPPTSQAIQPVYSPGNTASTPGSYRIKLNAKPLPPPGKPSESNALGGLTAGNKTAWKPNSDDGGNKGNVADSKEVAFNKMSGKTFPSLVVAARPHLRLKYIPQSNITHGRSGLDAKVKGVLMYTPSTFTEWLIQEGLIKNEQTCQFHVNNDLSPVKLKLGMYSDVTKFPYSGGYVWISPCCPSQFISVFSGSIFEGAPHPPTTILKLIYHWACQTNVQNVVQWVKVDNFYVKNFFTNMRAVCTQALHQKHQKLGGPRSKIEVGVISLGTTSQDGNMRQVKVEVLGVMDPENKLIRLRALEPISEEKNFKRRFVKILEPLEEWVHKESTIFTDFTVDKGTLINMGFRTVYQISASDPPTKYSNQNVMEYLRRIVPRMFQNTLSLLSRQIIQQFLDELVWREMWGPIPSQAFDKIIAHIAEQTKLDASESLLVRLNKVASNPFKNWNYSVWKPAPVSLSNTKAQQPTTDLDAVPLFTRLASMETTDSVPSILKNSRTRKRTVEQATMDLVSSPSPVKKASKFAGKDKIKKEEKPRILEKSFKSPEKDRVITEDIVSFINDKTAQIPVDSFYYGTREGDEEIIAGEYKGAFDVRCSICNKRFSENILLMKHMILHCQLEPFLKVNLKNVQQCSHCFLGFDTHGELKEHIDEVHLGNQNKPGLDCQICEEKFLNRVELIYHMHRTHVEMELPYECGVCLFRTSVYKLLTDHFVKVHKGGEHVLCPFCLKVVTFTYKGKCLERNIRFYETHLERHTRTTLTKKCHRCRLSFIHKGILDQHLEADHCGFKCKDGVTPFADRPNPIMMPEPGSLIKPATPPKSLKIYRARPLFNSVKFKALEINGIEDDIACVECEGSLNKPDHFAGTFNCLKCHYTTCCEKAMAQHVTIAHESNHVQVSIGKPIFLPEGIFCVCGYSTYWGNQMAKHLVLCEKKSAYLTEEAAKPAIVSTDETLSKAEHSEAQNMLNMLGLVRKSPENEFKISDDNVKLEYSRSSEDKESDSNYNAESNMEVDNFENSDESTVKNDSFKKGIEELEQIVKIQDISKSDVEEVAMEIEKTEEMVEEVEQEEEEIEQGQGQEEQEQQGKEYKPELEQGQEQELEREEEQEQEQEKEEQVNSEGTCEEHCANKTEPESEKLPDKIDECLTKAIKDEETPFKEGESDSSKNSITADAADENEDEKDDESEIDSDADTVKYDDGKEDSLDECAEDVEDVIMSDVSVKQETNEMIEAKLEPNTEMSNDKGIEEMAVNSIAVAGDEVKLDAAKEECPLNTENIESFEMVEKQTIESKTVENQK